MIIDKEKNEAELGYWVGHKFWGQGFARAAISEALSFAFIEQKFNRVHAHTLERNTASQKVLEKSFFRFIETKPNTNPKWDETDRVRFYEIYFEEWKKNRN